MEFETVTSAQEAPETPENSGESVEIGTYCEAIETYLAAADWLAPEDAPLRVHARSIARSLDRQMSTKGEIQSALASSFDKVLIRLESRRPAPVPAPAPDPLTEGTGPHGEASIFGLMDDDD